MSVPFEIDHLFVMTSQGAPLADTLVEAGLTEGTSRTHPGQGTSNRRFFFENAMLEFLWIHDPVEAGSKPIRPTYLLDRWNRRDSGSSPFGLCFRPVDDTVETPPFPAWDYEPPYLPPEFDIKVADNAPDPNEPFLFFLPWGHPPEDPPHHDAGLHELTEATVHSPAVTSVSDSLRAVSQLIHFAEAERHHLTLVFDDGTQDETLDLPSAEPLTIRY